MDSKQDIDNCGKYLVFSNKYPQGSISKVKIKNIVDFGIFVSFLDNNFKDIEGLIHLSDLSWSNNSHKIIKHYKIHDEIEVKILNINVKKEKIFLGIKQLKYDPFEVFLRKINLGDNITVIVSKIEDNGILVYIYGISNVLFIEQEYLPNNGKLIVGQKVKAEVLSIENYNLILSLI